MSPEYLRQEDECDAREPVPSHQAGFSPIFQNRDGRSPYLLQLRSSPEIIMAPRIAFFATTLSAVLTWTSAAFASQGPGAGPGTASPFTQLVMAVIVYGISALVVGAGLIGAVRRR
jgi:hypothetical protein